MVFILRADNDGEGGVMALAALARKVLGAPNARLAGAVLVLGVLGASLFYGDSIITPAISVLSAIEGLEVSSPRLADLVLPMSVVILAVLFAVQRRGTHRVGSLFGPVMVLWFAAIGVAGLAEVIRQPGILGALSPTYAATFVADHGRPKRFRRLGNGHQPAAQICYGGRQLLVGQLLDEPSQRPGGSPGP